MDKQVDLQVFLSEQTRNNISVGATGADVAESKMVRKNDMKRVRLVVEDVRERQDEASAMAVTRWGVRMNGEETSSYSTMNT